MKAPTPARHSNFLVALAVCIFAYWHTSTFAYSAEVEVGNLGITSLEVSGETVLTGVGGVKLSSLSIPADAKLVFDPIATPVKVSATPTFEAGAKIALSSDFAGMTCGRVVLMTYNGTASIPAGLFDTSSVATSASASCVLSQDAAPDGKNKQLVLTVGDYANAPEIRILPIGDSITQGIDKENDKQYDYPQYRTSVAARLAANGYKPVMKGIWHYSQLDAAGVQQPDKWRWHCGISGDGVMTSSKFGGVRDNLHLYLDVAGYTDVITLLIGINDMGWDGKSVDVTYVAWTNMVHEMSVQRPAAKIIASTVLECRDQYIEKVKAFNSRLRADYEAHNLPGNMVLLDLFKLVPLSVEGNFFYDDLHPNWKGDAAIAKCFAGKIMETLPLPAFTGTADPTVTDVAQTALGAINTVPPAYRSGMCHVFTIDAAGAANSFYGSAPYTATNTLMALDRPIVKAGYYMELVRAGTNRRRYVWVDFDATGKTLDQVDWPWNGGKFHQVVTNLHVYSNDSGIKNISASASGCKGVVEATSANYSNKDGQIAGLPRDMIGGNKFGWNDSLNDSGSGYGCFQVHRIFSQKGDDTYWNNAQVLIAWNRWGGNVSGIDEIGIGDYACHASGVGPTMDYTLTVNNGSYGLPNTVGASAYQVRHLEIWVEPVGQDVYARR